MLLLDLVDQFDTSEGDSRVDEVLEAQHQSHPLFHATMVLFDQVIEIFACSHHELCRKNPFLLEYPYRLMRSSIPIQREFLGEALFFDRLLQKLLRGYPETVYGLGCLFSVMEFVLGHRAQAMKH